ncbi:MAG TPA: amidohydrolase family protein [Gemmatimonadales bacterium]|nr:amidohydrolase family protein [Gemmatimonadales bacterium]
MVATLRLAGVAVVGLALALPLAAQQPSTAYAITNARIVPVSGPAIDKGTVVIRNGVITGVGANVTAPADARSIDGTGLTVYPGFIDAYSSLGYATAQPAAGAAATAATAGRAGRGTAAATPVARTEGAPNSNYGIGMQPEVRAVDQLDPDESAFDAAHAAGFTTALTGNSAGIFRGQSALINLNGTDVSAMVVKSSVAQHIGFSRGAGGGRGGGGGGFPSSLMGVFAQLRQELLDAQHYHDLKAAYDRNPRGMPRPDYDPSLEALQPVLAGTQQAVMFANTEREIVRALDLAKEFHLHAVIAGGAEAYKVADRLKADNVPVLLSLNFPRAGAGGAGGGGGFGGGGGRGGGGDPSDPEPLRMLRDRVYAPKGPEILANAGVKFIFESGNNYADALANMRKAVAGGLPADQALKAMTWAPADFFGVSDRMGSIEVGKIANLTITRGDLLDPATRVTQLFVDGSPVAIAAPVAGANGAAGGRTRPGLDATGAWQVSVSLDGVDHLVTVHLAQDDDRLYGVVEGALGAMDILDGGVDADGTFYFTVMLTRNGSTDEAEFDGTMESGAIRGKLSVEDHAGGTFSGGRAQ